MALAVAAALAVAGCGGGSESSTPATTGTATDAGKSGGNGDGQPGGNQGGGAADRASKGRAGPEDGRSPGEREPGITPQQREEATTANVGLESPAFKAGARLPEEFTCDGEDASPPLRWSGLPADAAELVLFALNLRPVKRALFFDWAVAGLDPGLEGIDEDELPEGAAVGRNSLGKRGYSICPSKEAEETFVFLLYAIPRALNPDPGFDPLELREEVVKQGGNVGLLSASYQRK